MLVVFNSLITFISAHLAIANIMRLQRIKQVTVGIFGSSISFHFLIFGIVDRLAISTIMVCAAAPLTLDVLSSSQGPFFFTQPFGVELSKPFGLVLSKGRLVFEYAQMRIDEEAISNIVQRREKLRLPMCFWPGCCRRCFQMVCTAARRKWLSKALLLYIRSLRALHKQLPENQSMAPFLLP